MDNTPPTINTSRILGNRTLKNMALITTAWAGLASPITCRHKSIGPSWVEGPIKSDITNTGRNRAYINTIASRLLIPTAHLSLSHRRQCLEAGIRQYILWIQSVVGIQSLLTHPVSIESIAGLSLFCPATHPNHRFPFIHLAGDEA